MSITPIPGFSEPFSSLSHLLFASLGFIASFILIYRGRGNTARVISLVIYSFCLVFLFSMSSVYHLLVRGSTPNYVLGILDHSGIFLMIAGSFTPIHMILFRGLHRVGTLFLIWSLAITGLTLTAIFFDDLPEGILLSFFLGLGWVGLISMYYVYKIHSRKIFTLLFCGGFCYSLGAYLDYIRWPGVIIDGIMGSHELFHIFVILGASFHWVMIYLICDIPISKKIVFIVKEYPNKKWLAQAQSENIKFRALSLESIKKQIHNWTDESFHHKLRPNQIVFKYFKEEKVQLHS